MIQTEVFYNNDDVENFEEAINTFLKEYDEDDIISVTFQQSGRSVGGIYYPVCFIVYKSKEAVKYEEPDSDNTTEQDNQTVKRD